MLPALKLPAPTARRFKKPLFALGIVIVPLTVNVIPELILTVLLLPEAPNVIVLHNAVTSTVSVAPLCTVISSEPFGIPPVPEPAVIALQSLLDDIVIEIAPANNDVNSNTITVNIVFM
jgi:hypothetical protein